ncbi:MAG: hypothetical protein ACK4NO_02675 [Glycocaulis sp.]
MDYFSSFSTIVIPRWAQFCVVAVLLALALIYGGLAYQGIVDDSRSGWLMASAQLLAILIPLLLVIVVVASAQGGVSGLITRTRQLLDVTIPERATILVDPEFQLAAGAKKVNRPAVADPEVQVFSTRKAPSAIYAIRCHPHAETDNAVKADGRALVFAVEINATKANVVLLLPSARMEEAGAARDVAAFEGLVPHTLEAARAEGYWVNPRPVRRTLFGQAFTGVVLARRLDADFLVNPVKKLDFAQDLMFMVRGFINEQPGLFLHWQDIHAR